MSARRFMKKLARIFFEVSTANADARRVDFQPSVRAKRQVILADLIILRQVVPLVEVDHEMVGGAAFPPARIIIVLGNLEEAELKPRITYTTCAL